MQIKELYKLVFIVVILVIIVLFYYLYYSTVNNFSVDDKNKKKYYKCGRLGNNDPTEKVLKSNNYSRTTDKYDNWDIYIPCGYTNVENELDDFSYFSKSYNKSPPVINNEIIDINNKNNNENKQKLKERKTIFAISGCDLLASKDKLWEALVSMYGRSKSVSIMPESYITANKNDMELFKNRFTPNKMYICKKNIQDKKGLELVFNNNYNDILKKVYSENYKVIQEYLSEPFLIKNRKLNLRLYFVVICDGKVNTYLYYEGKCIYTNKDYNKDANTNDLESHITSVNLDANIYESLPESLQQLKSVVGNDKYSSLMDKITNNLKLVSKAINGDICQVNKDYDSFQLFGLDIIIDQNMNPYILEFNKGPSMQYKTTNDKKLKTQLFNDLFCLANLSNSEKCLSNQQPNINNPWIKIT